MEQVHNISIAEWTIKSGTKLTSKKYSDQRNPPKPSHKVGLNRRGKSTYSCKCASEARNTAQRSSRHISLSALLVPCLSFSSDKMKIMYPKDDYVSNGWGGFVGFHSLYSIPTAENETGRVNLSLSNHPVHRLHSQSPGSYILPFIKQSAMLIKQKKSC